MATITNKTPIVIDGPTILTPQDLDPLSQPVGIAASSAIQSTVASTNAAPATIQASVQPQSASAASLPTVGTASTSNYFPNFSGSMSSDDWSGGF